MKQGIVKNVPGYLHLKIAGMIMREFAEVFHARDKNVPMVLVKRFVPNVLQEEFVLIGLLEKYVEPPAMDVVIAKGLIKVLATALK